MKIKSTSGEIISALVVALAGVAIATTLLTTQLTQQGTRLSPRAYHPAAFTLESTNGSADLSGSSNNIFTRAIELVQKSLLNIFAFISQLTRVPGVQKSTCSPILPDTDPGSCQYQYPNLKITVLPTRATAAQLLSTSWSTLIENNSINPSTPLVADVDGTSAGMEVAFISGKGELYIYKADGTLHASTAGTNVAGPPPNRTPEYAPSAILLDGDATREIIFPSSLEGVGSGTLRGYRGDGSPLSGSGILATFPDNVGTPNYAAVVDDWDGDGNPEIFVTTQNPVGSTSSLLGWESVGGVFTGLDGGNPLLLSVSGTTGIAPNILPVDLLPPAIGDIDTDATGKEVVVAFEQSEGNMQIFVLKKSGSTVAFLPSGTPSAPNYWYQERIDEMVSVGVQYSQLGGIALVDYNGDGRHEVIATTQKKVQGNEFGYYYVRSFTHDTSTNGGVIFAPRWEIQSGYLGVSRPSVGDFDVRPGPEVVFKTVGISSLAKQHALFAARYNSANNVFEWIRDDSENDFPTPRRILDKVQSYCDVREEMSLSSISLANTQNAQGALEMLYHKYHAYLNTSFNYSVKFFDAANTAPAPIPTPNCPSLGYWDVPSFYGGQNASGINKPVYSLSNVEIADVDVDGTPEAAFTYSYEAVNVLRLHSFPSNTTGLTQWPMTGGSECRQGRYQGVCPAGPGGPTFTPVPTLPIPTITPPISTSPAPSITPSIPSSTPVPTSTTPVPTLPPGGSELFLPLIMKDAPSTSATTKILSTNYTLLNMGGVQANVTANYILPGGVSWPGVGDAEKRFTVAGNYGQLILRQYDLPGTPSSLQAGSGAVAISASQQLAGVVQILARNQTPSSGAYLGLSEGSQSVYIPIVARAGISLTGTVNSQIIIQNTQNSATTVEVVILNSAGATVLTRSFSSLPAYSSSIYNLANETGLPTNFFGSAVVRATSTGGKIAVVSNLFAGTDSLQTFNGFPAESVGNSWVIPLFASRLSNGFTTGVSVQNLSGGTLGVGAIQLNCIPSAGSPGQSLNLTNSTSVLNNSSYSFNSAIDKVNFPAGWYGSCRLTATGNIVAVVHMRQLDTANAATYEAINASSTDRRVLVPLVLKRLPNGFATVVTVQNLSTTSSTQVTFLYTKASDGTTISVGPISIAPGANINHNHRLDRGGGVDLPDGWVGSLTVTSTSAPIGGVVQVTTYNNQPGDTLTASNAFTLP